MNALDWIEVFKVGRHTDASGNTRDWALPDMQTIVTRYNNQPQETRHVAPFVLGHPLDNSPSYGWAERLALRGTSVWAGLRDVDEGVKEAVRQGRYEKISIALYDDLLLMHIGLLGAVPPAVKGMTPVAFGSRKAAHLFHLPRRMGPGSGIRRHSPFMTGNDMDVLTAFVEWMRQNYGDEAANQTQGKIDELRSGVLQSMQEFVTTSFGADVGAAAEAKLAELQAAPQPEEPATAAADPAAPSQQAGQQAGQQAQHPSQHPSPNQPPPPVPASASEALPAPTATGANHQDAAFADMRKELDAIQRRERDREYDDFATDLIRQGRVVPASKADIKRQLENAFTSDAKGITTGALDGTKKLFSSLPPAIQFGEVATRSGGMRPTKAIAENFGADQSLDTESIKRAERIKEYAQQYGVSIDVAYTALARKGEL